MSFTLVVSPESYPWDLAKEQTFVAPELEVLAREDLKLIVLPQRTGGERLPVPPSVEVDDAFAREAAQLSRRAITLHALQTRMIAEELIDRPAPLRSPAAMKRLVDYAGRARHAEAFARHWVPRQVRGDERIVFASTWWGPVTTGFAMAARSLPQLRVVSRAHGFDLYEDRHVPPYQPCRRRALGLAHGIFPDSEMGTEWLRRTYSSVPRIDTARLGVVDPRVTCRGSTDGVLRVVSCSLQVPVKRLDLLIDGLGEAGRSGQRIEWTHHGTGDLQTALEQRARQLPTSVKWTFAGYSTQAQLYRWYETNPVDVFVNVSKSEGTPVAIMEAIACGIPALVTSVGGNPEICRPENGVRVSANPTAAELGSALIRFAGPESRAWRAGSRRVWQERYDAEANFRSWAATLRVI
jgi:glycosyltransferase involved in cell wall biosynthesis